MIVCDRCGKRPTFVLGLDETERSNPPRTKFLASYELCRDCADMVVELVREAVSFGAEVKAP